MTYGDFKDFPRRAASDKGLHDKTFEIASNSRYDGYQRGLHLMLYTFFDTKVGDTSTHTRTGIFEN